jgi:hypothetical protein
MILGLDVKVKEIFNIAKFHHFRNRKTGNSTFHSESPGGI